MARADKENIRTVAGKREFFKTFLNSVRDELIAKADKMPEEWDGNELRWLVADKFEYEQRHRAAQVSAAPHSNIHVGGSALSLQA